jgi:hypothetical protein
LRRPVLEKIGIIGKELHDHRLRRAGKIPNHVLQQLNELHIEHRLGLRDFVADFADHVVDAALALVLQFDGEVTRVRFRYRKNSKLQAGAARCAFHFRRFANDPLNMVKDAIRFLK